MCPNLRLDSGVSYDCLVETCQACEKLASRIPFLLEGPSTGSLSHRSPNVHCRRCMRPPLDELGKPETRFRRLSYGASHRKSSPLLAAGTHLNPGALSSSKRTCTAVGSRTSATASPASVERGVLVDLPREEALDRPDPRHHEVGAAGREHRRSRRRTHVRRSPRDRQRRLTDHAARGRGNRRTHSEWSTAERHVIPPCRAPHIPKSTGVDRRLSVR